VADIEFGIDVERDGTRFTVHLRGDLDFVSAPEFNGVMQSLLTDTPEGTRVFIDASELTYIDSVGIGLLVKCWQIVKNDGHALAIVEPQPFVRQLLGVTGLDFLIHEVPTEPA
jgi:anti-sigma B factor antagonist